MEARAFLLLVLHATIFDSITCYDWLSKHYLLAERYNCPNLLDIFFDRAVVFKYGELFVNSWAGNADFDCTTSVYSRTKNSGIISVIQKLKFRSESRCVDFVKTSDSEREKCGEIIFGMRPTSKGSLPPAPFISKHPGPFLWYRPTYPTESINFGYTHSIKRERLVPIGSAVEPSTELQVLTHLDSHAMRQDVEMVMALTSFRECDTHDIPLSWFNCGYGVCISSKYVNDGIVNCPFGDCIDEGGCQNAMNTSPLINGTSTAPDSDAILVFANTTDDRALEDSPGMDYTVTAVKDLDVLLSHLLKDDHLIDIVAELKKHNEILDGIYRLMEMMTGMMMDKKQKNSTAPLVLT